MNIDTQDLPSYIAGYDDYIDDTRPIYSTREYNDMKEELESKIEDKEDEIERLNNIINKALTNIDIVQEIIYKQPSKDNVDDFWILDKLDGIRFVLKGSEKE